MKMEETIKTIEIICKKPHRKLIMLLDGIIKTEVVFEKLFDTPILVVTYIGLKQEYFSFINVDIALELKNAIDEKRDYVILEEV
jgi:hypothetical protein